MRIPFLLFFSFFPCLVSYAADQPSSSKPNILVILTDDQGRGDYSAFGTKDIQTPAIDRLCHEGMTFDNFYANSCVCSPSRAALLSGCYPDRVGVPGLVRDLPDENWGWLTPKVTLLPKLLKTAGYHTAVVGSGISAWSRPTCRTTADSISSTVSWTT
jgi:arylsulfatase A-like enzyme